MLDKIKNQIREICTYHSKGETSGYLLDEQRFAKIFELVEESYKKGFDDAYEEATERVKNFRKLNSNIKKWEEKQK
jgi:proteasome assembly chaperone (PAC2) family protein